MRTLIAPAFVALLVGGCGRLEAPTKAAESSGSSLAMASRSETVAQHARPIKGSCTLTFELPPFPLPAVFRQVDSGPCSFSHLGESTLYGVQEINVVAGTQSGSRTFTAANGDLLTVTHTGTSQPIGPGMRSFSAVLTITGGTGRFANATGYLNGSGIANMITRTTQSNFEGAIVYDASDRSAR